MRLPVFKSGFSLLILAVAAGLCSAWAARTYLRNAANTLEANGRIPHVERVVAMRDLQAGAVIEPDDLALRSFPASCVASDSMDADRALELQGMVMRTSLAAGDALLPSHILGRSAEGLSSQLEIGRRAISLPVDAINVQSGLLQAGDLIDLYVSFDHQRRRITAPLLQGVLVLAAGASTMDAASNPSVGADDNTVTLDAAPEDAIKLIAAREGGVLTAVLRAPGDGSATQAVARDDLAGMLGLKPGKEVSHKARVIYGNKTVRSVPALAPQVVETMPASGLHQLPYLPLLSRPAAEIQALHDTPVALTSSRDGSVWTVAPDEAVSAY